MAGRFVFFKSDKPDKGKGLIFGFGVYFNKQGDAEARTFQPDEKGYVYVAVTEGQYNIGSIYHTDFHGNSMFLLDPMPVMHVNADDSVVNFGTLEIRFYQSTGAKVSAFLVGLGKTSIKVNHIPNQDDTRPEISSKVGFAGTIRDINVSFVPRKK